MIILSASATGTMQIGAIGEIGTTGIIMPVTAGVVTIAAARFGITITGSAVAGKER
jgi:hypothetical protein